MPRYHQKHLHRAAPLSALLLFVLALWLAFGVDGQAKMRTENLTITTSSGAHAFNVEVADTGEEKARGLMFRRTMADDAGMLFPYAPAQEAQMWMKNTYISLDMVFIKQDGTVHRIEAGTEPFSERVISSRGDVTAVLELKAGIAAKIQLAPGDKVTHRLFQDGK